MATSLTRSDVLRGALRAKQAPARPPWALPEAAFTDACTRCGDCLSACPENIVTPDRSGYPKIDFMRGACTFCGACTEVCEAKALTPESDRAPGFPPWAMTARVAADCLSATGITCRACGDHCEPGAIAFRLAVGGAAHPIVDTTRCTGCGACVAPCPVGAIEMA